MKKQLIFFCLLFPYLLFSQVEPTSVLSIDSFLSIVKKHHPIAYQANIKLESGEANLLSARGKFDPKIEADVAQKYFKGDEYYDLGEGKLKIPTWFGIDLESGYERNQGQFLNPENNVPNAGLWFAGISVPIGQGLFIDERRNELRKAQSMLQQSQSEKDLLLNQLVLSSGLAYWEWFKSYNNLKVYEDALVLAQQRYQAVKLGAELGDVPFIDTLEAGIQYQNRLLNLQQAQLIFKNSTAFLSIYLWQEGVIPLEIREGTIPTPLEDLDFSIKSLRAQKDSLLNQHPEILINRAQIDQLEFDERWAKEQIKPQLNLKYQPITEAISNDPLAEYSINNYTWGLSFRFPLFLRKERGKLNLIRLKIDEKQLLLENKREGLSYKIDAAINEIETSRNQITLYTKTTQDYNGLLDGERRLFNNGESSLFLVNSRELGFINAQIKLIELWAKNQSSRLKLAYALGNLNQ